MKPVVLSAVIAALIFISCTVNNNATNAAGAANNTTATVTATQPETIALPADSFVNFHNIEMVEYCVPVPLIYKENYKEASSKGSHVFLNSASTESNITVSGLIRSDTSVTILQYFKNTYDTAAAEEEGNIIEEKQLLPQQNCFYAKGYWNNMYYKTRFLEITWLRPDEVVVYKVEMPVTDTSFWYRQLSRIIMSNASCY
jgi:hypothetical protein